MPRIKTDEEMRSVYAPVIKAFTDERLTAENAKRIYEYLKPYHYDTDGWRLYGAAKGILQSDVYSEFPAEDNMGYFETLNGYNLLKWLEIAKFADKQYEQLPGGYEKLKSHTLDEESPEYKEYQGKLYAAAIRSITIDLIAKQPYLLDGFWNRVSYIENILEKGFPTRQELNEKIEREYKAVYNATTEGDLDAFHSEVQCKAQLRFELQDIFLSDEAVQALFIKDNALEEAYQFYLESDRVGEFFLTATDYAEKAERDYLAFRAFDRVKLEYEDFIDSVKEMPVNKIIDEAYKITIMHDLHIHLEPETSSFSIERLRALHSLDSPLWSLYHEWQRRDWTHSEDINDVIMSVADENAAENKENNFEDEEDLETEEGYEP